MQSSVGFALHILLLGCFVSHLLVSSCCRPVNRLIRSFSWLPGRGYPLPLGDGVAALQVTHQLVEVVPILPRKTVLQNKGSLHIYTPQHHHDHYHEHTSTPGLPSLCRGAAASLVLPPSPTNTPSSSPTPHSCASAHLLGPHECGHVRPGVDRPGDVRDERPHVRAALAHHWAHTQTDSRGLD